MLNYTVTGEKKALKGGLVDYLADGYIEMEGEKVPCEIGFTDYNGEVEATHVFIKSCITDNGTHFEAQTIRL